jgi:hypothetical protein
VWQELMKEKQVWGKEILVYYDVGLLLYAHRGGPENSQYQIWNSVWLSLEERGGLKWYAPEIQNMTQIQQQQNTTKWSTPGLPKTSDKVVMLLMQLLLFLVPQEETGINME